jgi:hypothetical protein
MKLYSMLAFLPFLAVGCVQATVSDSLGLNESFSYTLPTLPVGEEPLPAYNHTFTQSQEENVSDVISKLADVGTVGFSVVQSTATTNMTIPFVSHIEVDILQQGGQDLVIVDADTTLPNLVSVTPGAVGSPSSETLNLPIVASNADILAALGSGEVTLSVSVTMTTTGTDTIPSGILTLDYTLGLEASISVQK